MYIFILGRQPELSLAELESVFGADNVRLLSKSVALSAVDFPAGFKPAHLGGAIKVAKVVGRNWSDIDKLLPTTGKVTLGLSSDELSAQELQKIGVSIKRRRGSVRFVPNPSSQLSSAVVLHNRLFKGGNRFEFIWAGGFLAQTIYVQDINSYTLRDRGRPKRDARVGMLPPKLAQIMINLAAGQQRPPALLLDPFCGTGVVLQEALLMGFDALGSDLDPRMVKFTQENLSWLNSKFSFAGKSHGVTQADATNHHWSPAPNLVVSETYLGQPYASPPPPEKLAENIHTCNQVIKKFLQNLHSQINQSSKICLAVPAWYIGSKTLHLPMLEELNKLGFERHHPNLIYHRSDQIVGRELLLLQKSQ